MLVLVYLIVEIFFFQCVRRRVDLRVVRMALLGLIAKGITGPLVIWLLGPLTVGLVALAGERLSLFSVGAGV